MDGQCSCASASVSDPDRLLGRVLVIDDDADNANVIANLFAGVGYGVVRASDGIAGARLAEQIQPDVVLVNLALPMHSGLDVLNRLNELHPTRELAVTLASRYALVLLRSEAGSADCLPQKPFDFKEMMRRVRPVGRGSSPE